MAFDLYLYNCSADPALLDKTADLTDQVLHSGTVRGPIDVCRPEILIDGTVTGKNYAYIPDFGRYYFIDPDIRVERTGLTLLQLRVDPLMSFKSGIKDLPALCLRTEDRMQHTPFINDPLAPASSVDWCCAFKMHTFAPGAINILVTAG